MTHSRPESSADKIVVVKTRPKKPTSSGEEPIAKSLLLVRLELEERRAVFDLGVKTGLGAIYTFRSFAVEEDALWEKLVQLDLPIQLSFRYVNTDRNGMRLVQIEEVLR